ncbi:hypothetical protein [Paracerasibacillus soli]|uniref:Uncharacterized protein n=1 Tax=Paracerasibacillus soli TaxID=480284 RepID=A0ABU5CP98_9BACI|nr:hypothetical protein [Virgibacillus soli]MDY0407667.1 hypothetical protein [Virgibacillus soli]
MEQTMLNQIMDALNMHGKQIREDIRGLDKKVDSLENKVQRLEKRVNSLENKVDNLEGKVNSLENKVNSLESKVTIWRIRWIKDSIDLTQNFPECVLNFLNHKKQLIM